MLPYFIPYATVTSPWLPTKYQLVPSNTQVQPSCCANVNLAQDSDTEHTPQLFENEHETKVENSLEEEHDSYSEKLFDQDTNDEDEDFEIPAFLRKQKF